MVLDGAHLFLFAEHCAPSLQLRDIPSVKNFLGLVPGICDFRFYINHLTVVNLGSVSQIFVAKRQS